MKPFDVKTRTYFDFPNGSNIKILGNHVQISKHKNIFSCGTFTKHRERTQKLKET